MKFAQREPMGEDDARTFNTHIGQGKHTIPHSTMKNTMCVTVSDAQQAIV